ncbi:MAG: hypothetical protein U9Q03_03075 [Patescibacteria group bacterium]|nr:hypothetical protein [Patescibacteria group bacterium]
MAQLIGPGDIIVRSWENFRKHIHAYAEMVVWFVVLSVLQWTILIVLQAIIPDKASRIALYVLLSLPGSLAFLAVTAATIDITVKGLTNKKIDARKSIHHGFHKLLSLLWVVLLVTVITAILGALPFAVPGLIALLWLNTAPQWLAILIVMLLMVGMLASLIIPVVLFVWLKFSPYHVIAEDKKGTRALIASRDLVIGRWWPTFLRIIIPLLFFLITARFVKALVYLIIGSSFGDPGMFFGEIADSDHLSRTHTLITTVIPQTIDGFALALFLGADVALWLDLKKKG